MRPVSAWRHCRRWRLPRCPRGRSGGAGGRRRARPQPICWCGRPSCCSSSPRSCGWPGRRCCLPAAVPILRTTSCSSITSNNSGTSCTIDRSMGRWGRWRTTRRARTCSPCRSARSSAAMACGSSFRCWPLTTALTAGFVFLIARRLRLPIPYAIGAAILLFLPSQYFYGAFTHDGFLAQALATFFAVACLWALTSWDEQPYRNRRRVHRAVVGRHLSHVADPDWTAGARVCRARTASGPGRARPAAEISSLGWRRCSSLRRSTWSDVGDGWRSFERAVPCSSPAS